MKKMISEILEEPEGLGSHSDGSEGSYTSANKETNILAYIGNVHLSPLCRAWNAPDYESPASSQGGRKLRLNKNKPKTKDDRL